MYYRSKRCRRGTNPELLVTNDSHRFANCSLFCKASPASTGSRLATMGKAKQTRKFAVTKKIISPKDTRVRENAEKAKQKVLEQKKKDEPRHVEQQSTALFFSHNTQLGPPYNILIDTNFINFSIRSVAVKNFAWLPSFGVLVLRLAASSHAPHGRKHSD